MKRCRLLSLVVLLSMVNGNLSAYTDCEGPLETGKWYVLPKIGVAPGILTNRGKEHIAVPGLAVPFDCVTTATGRRCRELATNQEGTILQDQCKIPKFNEAWSNGVLHVGGEIGYNNCDNGQWFIDLFYNRASGSCVARNHNYFLAPDGCPDDCSTTCNTSGDPLFSLTRQDNYADYSAFGAYLGHRHYFNLSLCDSIAFFVGAKVGLQRRNKVCVDTFIPSYTVTLQSPGTAPVTFNNLFADRCLKNTWVCKSTSVSGGLQVGADYCINDCLSLLVGLEVQATCGFRMNRNIRIPQATPTVDGTPSTEGRDIVLQMTNILGCGSGTFLQFPVWAGLRWEFDWCNDLCNPCA